MGLVLEIVADVSKIQFEGDVLSQATHGDFSVMVPTDADCLSVVSVFAGTLKLDVRLRHVSLKLNPENDATEYTRLLRP